MRSLKGFNRIVAENDLPEFYDPIESSLYKDNLDSYNFHSIYHFMTSRDKRSKFDITYEGIFPIDSGTQLFNRILLVWLGRILSERLMTEVLSYVLEFEFDGEIKERELLVGKTGKMKELIDRFYQCFQAEQEEYLKES